MGLWASTYPHRYWSVSLEGSTAQVNCAELALRAVAGGPNVAVGGTAIANGSYSGSYLPAKAFDGDAATFWVGPAGTVPGWIGYDFGAGNQKVIAEVAYRNRPDGYTSESPATIRLQASDDGVTWSDEAAWSGLSGWAAGEQRVFTRQIDPDPLARWRCESAVLTDDCGVYTAGAVVGLDGSQVVAGANGTNALLFGGAAYASVPADAALQNALLASSTIDFTVKVDPAVYGGALLALWDSQGHLILKVGLNYSQVWVAWGWVTNPNVVWNGLNSSSGSLRAGWRHVAIRRTFLPPSGLYPDNPMVKTEFFIDGRSASGGGTLVGPLSYTAGPPACFIGADTPTSPTSKLTATLDDLRITPAAVTNATLAEMAAVAGTVAVADKPGRLVSQGTTTWRVRPKYGTRLAYRSSVLGALRFDSTGVIVTFDQPVDAAAQVADAPPDALFDVGVPQQLSSLEVRIPITVPTVVLSSTTVDDEGVTITFDRHVVVPSPPPVPSNTGDRVTAGTPEQDGPSGLRVPLDVTSSPPGGGGGGFAVIFPR